MQHKRTGISIDQRSFKSKRFKTHMAPSSKEKKEKVGDQVSALQQLVSPFGKTDTASVLLEAIGYIKFLHDQVKLLVAPYIYGTPMQAQDEKQCCLKGQGLCLMPTAFTVGAASSNGADIWAQMKTGASNSTRMSSNEGSVITQI